MVLGQAGAVQHALAEIEFVAQRKIEAGIIAVDGGDLVDLATHEAGLPNTAKASQSGQPLNFARL